MDLAQIERLTTAELLELQRTIKDVLSARDTSAAESAGWVAERRPHANGYYQLERVVCGSAACKKCKDRVPKDPPDGHPRHWFSYTVGADGKLKRKRLHSERQGDPE